MEIVILMETRTDFVAALDIFFYILLGMRWAWGPISNLNILSKLIKVHFI